ncbi:MAG: hypothetical protein CMO01_25730 [Thalassobius sp.]|nr:hypothetical protein [Thalassovita sp.]
MYLTLISIADLFVVATYGIYCLVVPTRKLWDGLTDVIVRIIVFGLLSLFLLLISYVGAYHSEYANSYHQIMLAVAVLPSLAFLIFGFAFLLKIYSK